MVKKVMSGSFAMIPVEEIDRPRAGIRMDIDQVEIEALARSIEVRGLQSPIEVARRDGRYEVVFGDRRYLAHKFLGLKEIEARVVDKTDREIFIARATENIGRQDMSPIEDSITYKRMVDDLGMSIDEIGKAVGKSPGIVKRRLDLLKMDGAIQRAVHAKQISAGVAEELDRCPDRAYMSYLLEMSIDHGVTVAVARQWVNDKVNELRRSRSDVGGTCSDLSVYESKPTYISCQLCQGPLDVMKAVRVVGCPDCIEAIREVLKNTRG